MAQGTSLFQDLSQIQALYPQLIQTYRLMTLPVDKLREEIKKEIDENPALLLNGTSASTSSLGSFSSGSTSTTAIKRGSSNFGEAGGTRISSSGGDAEAADRFSKFYEAQTRSESLQEHLFKELGLLKLSDEERAAGELIISNLDPNGFSTVPPESLAKTDKMMAAIRSVLPKIQHLDPTGCAVSDWRESVTVQASELGLSPKQLDVFRGILKTENLEKLKAGRTDAVAKQFGLRSAEIESLWEILKSLDPYPGRRFSSDDVPFVIPDLSIKKNETGELELKINSDALPDLAIDPEYELMLKETDDRESKQFLSEKIRKGREFIKMVQERMDTLGAVGISLMKFQHDFFLSGPSALKPLVYRQVAEDIGKTESTVSRIANDKYIDTDFGLIPIKSLFSSSLATTTGEDTSQRAVMEMIREIVAGEDKKLSDQKIADILSERGIVISRRTVNKYRSRLKIDSSYER